MLITDLWAQYFAKLLLVWEMEQEARGSALGKLAPEECEQRTIIIKKLYLQNLQF
jgi:hypothetical protein